MQRDSSPTDGNTAPAAASSTPTVTHEQRANGWPRKEGHIPYMKLLGRFDLVRPLGIGGSGTVFEARDLLRSQTVALKLLHRCEPSDLYRFKGEFRALAEIAHPNLVAMHELFVDAQQRGFFTMELIQGRSLLDYVRPESSRKGPAGLPGTPQARLRACLEQLAHGVEYLHAHGKLHRDLKPSNVLVNPLSGRLTIVDFGLVHSLMDPTLQEADLPAFEGTPAYAAPEQIDSRDAGFASDWYAVGVMLYEALTGKRPFPDSPTLMHEKAKCDPPPPSAVCDALLCPELEAVCIALLARSPSERASARDVLAALGSSEQPRLVEPVPAFAGRDHELQQLHALFERALEGESAALSITGQSGIGKTSLAHAFLDHLRANGRAQVLRGRCYMQEALHHNALDGVMEALSDYLRRMSELELQPLIPSSVGALVQLFPMLRRVPAIDLATPCTLPHGEVRAQAFAALRQLFGRLGARGPLVLFIDDLQWADADSMRLLRELLRPRLRGVWVIATERDDAGSSRSVFERIGGGVQVQRLVLGPLGEDAVIELAQRLIDGCGVDRANEIARRSGGHPLFASELIRHARSDAGTLDTIALEAALEARLSLLSPPARALLELVCVAGQRVPQSLLLDGAAAPQLAALRELRVASAIRDSLVDEEQHVGVYHDRIRELVISRLTEARHLALHSTLAEQMRARGAPYRERAIQRYLLAGREREAALLAEEAAAQAAHGLAFHSAAELLELALRHAQDAAEQQRLRLAAAEASVQAGRGLAAAHHFEQAARLVSEPAERAELQLRAALGYCAAGHSQQGRELLRKFAGEREVPLELEPQSLANGVAWLMAMLLLGVPRLRSPQPGSDELPRARRRAPARPKGAAVGVQAVSGDEHLPLRLLWRIAPNLILIDHRQALYFASRAVGLAASQGQGAVYGQAFGISVGLAAAMSGQYSFVRLPSFLRARRLVSVQGEPWEIEFLRVIEGGAAMACGHDERAIELCFDAARATRLGSPFAMCVRTLARMTVLSSLGSLGRLQSLADLSGTWLKDAVDCGDRHMEATSRIASLRAHLGRDDRARALEEVELTRKVELDYAHAWLQLEPWWLGDVHLYCGEPERALALCEQLREGYRNYSIYVDQSRTQWHLFEGSCAAALAARGLDRERMLERLRRCARAARWGFGRRAPAIAAQLAATVACFDGDRARAATKLRRAIAVYDALGNRLHAASLRLALARLDPLHARDQERAAHNVFAEEGVVDAARFAFMLAPVLNPEPNRGAG